MATLTQLKRRPPSHDAASSFPSRPAQAFGRRIDRAPVDKLRPNIEASRRRATRVRHRTDSQAAHRQDRGAVQCGRAARQTRRALDHAARIVLRPQQRAGPVVRGEGLHADDRRSGGEAAHAESGRVTRALSVGEDNRHADVCGEPPHRVRGDQEIERPAMGLRCDGECRVAGSPPLRRAEVGGSPSRREARLVRGPR